MKSADYHTALANKEIELLRFMKQSGYGIYHASPVFVRDFQYGVRDYLRTTTGKDPGTLVADELALVVIDRLETQGILKKTVSGTWVLFNEEFLNQPSKETVTEEA